MPDTGYKPGEPLSPARAATPADLESAIKPLRDEIEDLGNEIAKLRKLVYQFLNQRPQMNAPPPEPAHAPPPREPKPVESRASGAAVAVTAKPAEPPPSTAELILSAFDAADRESGRSIELFRGAISPRLGSSVQRIEVADNAVLFYTAPDTAYVHPWTNQRLGVTWLSHFRLSPRGANYPVLRVEAMAMARQREDGAWENVHRGYAVNDN
jgi:hypothetical protein